MQLDGYFYYILLCYLTLPTMGYHSLISVSKKQIDNSSVSVKYFLPVNLETFRAILLQFLKDFLLTYGIFIIYLASHSI